MSILSIVIGKYQTSVLASLPVVVDVLILLGDMLQTRPEEILDVVVRQDIENLLPLSIVGDDVMLPKDLELVRDTALGEIEDLRDVVDTELMLQKQRDNREPCRIPEDRVEGREGFDAFGRKKLNLDLFFRFVVHKDIIVRRREQGKGHFTQSASL